MRISTKSTAGAKCLSVMMAFLCSTAFAKDKISSVSVHSISETECSDLEQVARLRLSKAHSELHIEPGTLALTANFAPESIVPGNCSPDGEGVMFCGPDHYWPSTCRLTYVTDGVAWIFKKTKTEKVKGKTRHIICEKKLAEMQQTPQNLYMKLNDFGLFQRHCQIETLRLEVAKIR